MALLAFQLCVFPLQSESCEPAVLIFLGIQSGQRKLPPIVFGVAARAVDLRIRNVVNTAVVAGALLHAVADFFVTIQALQTAAVGETKVVARRALRRAFQGLMWTGERTRRDLCPHTGSAQQQQDPGFRVKDESHPDKR